MLRHYLTAEVSVENLIKGGLKVRRVGYEIDVSQVSVENLIKGGLKADVHITA